MSGGGMGFIFAPARKAEAQERLQAIMSATKRELAARAAVRDGAGRLRLRDQRARHRSPTCSRATAALHAAGLLRADRAASCSGSDRRAALAAAPRGAGSIRRRLPHATRAARHGADALRPRCFPRGKAATATASRRSTSCSPTNGFDREQHEQIRADLRERPHRPRAEPPAGQHGDRRRARRTTSSTLTGAARTRRLRRRAARERAARRAKSPS